MYFIFISLKFAAAGAQFQRPVFGTDPFDAGGQCSVRSAFPAAGQHPLLYAGDPVQPHGLQRLLGAEPVFMGLSAGIQPAATEKEMRKTRMA